MLPYSPFYFFLIILCMLKTVWSFSTNALSMISHLLSRFILEHGQPFWYLLTMLESGTSELKTLTHGILAKKHMSGLWIQRLLTKLSCPFQTMPSFVVPLVNCRSMYLCFICAKYSQFHMWERTILIVYLFSFRRPEDISSATSIISRSKLFFTLLMIVCAVIPIFH